MYWCGRRDLNPHELALNRFSYLLRFSPPRLSEFSLSQVWGLDYPFTIASRSRYFRCCPSSLYTFLQNVRFEGLARDWLRHIHVFSFPRIWAVLLPTFPSGHSISWFKSVVYTDSTTSALNVTLSNYFRKMQALCDLFIRKSGSNVFWDTFVGSHHVYGRRVNTVLDMSGVMFLDNFYRSSAVFSDLINVCALH